MSECEFAWLAAEADRLSVDVSAVVRLALRDYADRVMREAGEQS